MQNQPNYANYVNYANRAKVSFHELPVKCLGRFLVVSCTALPPRAHAQWQHMMHGFLRCMKPHPGKSHHLRIPTVL